MSDEYDDYPVSLRNAEECEQMAAVLRGRFGVGSERLPPIMEVLELARNRVPEAKGLDVVVLPDEAMGRALAFARSQAAEIFVRQPILEGAIADSDEARFILFHELVHVIAHRGPRRFRIAGGNKSMEYIADHESAEWQANRITRAAFMPPVMVRSTRTAAELARTAGVPLKEAIARIRELNAGKAAILTPSQSLEVARAQALGATSSNQKARAQFEVLKRELWNALPVIEGEPPAQKRLCGIYQIWWSHFGKATECGWYIEECTIVSFFAMRRGR